MDRSAEYMQLLAPFLQTPEAAFAESRDYGRHYAALGCRLLGENYEWYTDEEIKQMVEQVVTHLWTAGEML